ncbi:hybrid sensor histidine kinase/response regulator transcription factor [Echinicola pacifica]|nr:hybrid sensor histidine kinase/response regulator transcription factor [Echinicola pacifica]
MKCSAIMAQGTGHPFYKFTHYTSQDGLPQNSILAILQDQKGYMWFGTDDGLARFDGYQFTVYKHQYNKPNSLSNNVIRGLAQDRNGYIWISSEGGGITIFDPSTSSFHSLLSPQLIDSKKTGQLLLDHLGNLWISTLTDGIFKVEMEELSSPSSPEEYLSSLSISHFTKANSGLADNKIWQVFEDSGHQLWIGTYDQGAQIFDPISEEFKAVNLPQSGRPIRSVKSFYEDHQQTLWLGTENQGLFYLPKGKSIFLPFGLKSDRQGEKNITSILQDQQSNIWIGTLGSGVYVHELNTGQTFHYDDNPSDSYSINGRSVYSMLEDGEGNIWIGMYSGAGLNKINPTAQHFEHYRPNINAPGSLSGKMVKSILLDQNENLWVGIFNDGLNVKRAGRSLFESIPLSPQSKKVSTNVQVIFEDQQQQIWIGTDGEGLYHYSPSRKTYEVYRHDEKDTSTLSKDEIWAIAEDAGGSLWIGMANGGGLNKFDPKTGKFQHFMHRQDDFGSPSFNDIRALLVDSKNRLWIGTYGGGLNRYDFDTQRFTYFQHLSSDPYSISHDIITSIFEDSKGTIWLGTFGGGLNKLDSKTGKFTHFRENDGLPSDVIKAVLEDDSGQLWISTVRGLSSFDPESETFKNFTTQDGLQSNEFNLGSAFKAANGKMYFGGTNGFNAFLPHQVSLPKSPHKPELTKLRVLNQLVNPGDTIENKVLLRKSISYTDELKLYSDHNSFELEFSGMEFNQQDKILYAYMLEGFDKDWVYTDATRRYAAYSNLKAGEYTFKVKSTSENGLQNSEERQLKLLILPPWYQSNLALIAYFLFLILMAFIIKSIVGFRIKMKNDLRFERLEKQKQEEINQLKLRFFTNISHELRTPLMLIKVPLEQLLRQKDLPRQVFQQLNSIHNNASRLLKLINQLLEFRKQETGHLRLSVQENNLRSFIQNVFTSFEAMANQGHIDFQLAFDDDLPERLWFDMDQMEKVAYNLCFNAFKFTPQGGKIRIVVKNSVFIQDNNPITGVEISIEDNGKGIPLEYQDRIFERFFQIEDSQHNMNAGTGIGLSLSKNIVEFHHGKISMTSVPHVQTTFTVFLPLGKEQFQAHDFRSPTHPKNLHQSALDKELTSLDMHMLSSINTAENIDAVDPHLKNKKLLLVEDNKELLALMKSTLQAHFNILTAQDGQEGFLTAQSQAPDIIISDVMMPIMDGIEMCVQLKKELTTSHIPVILLTARSNFDYQREGYSSGADDYLSKPFPMDLLIAKVRNLLYTREKLKAAYKIKPDLRPSEITISSPDAELMERALQIVENHMDDTDFDIPVFVKEMGMSRTILFDKIKAITDFTPNEFIQTVRLKRAAQLLLQSDYKIAEISYMVGFNNPKYFSKCFHKHFGHTPSKYATSKFKT